jgi:hypothetical protein
VIRLMYMVGSKHPGHNHTRRRLSAAAPRARGAAGASRTPSTTPRAWCTVWGERAGPLLPLPLSLP